MRPRSGPQGGQKPTRELEPFDPNKLQRGPGLPRHLERVAPNPERSDLIKRIERMHLEHKRRMRNARYVTIGLASLVVGGLVTILSVLL